MNRIKTKTDAVTTLKWTREVAAIGGAVTGVTVIWGMVYFNVADATGSAFVGGLSAIVAIVVGLFIIDFSYRRNFPYVADLIVSGQAFRNWRIFLFTLFLLILSGAQMLSSGFLSWEGRKDVAEGIVKAPELQNIASIKVAADKTTSQKIREVKAQIATIDRDIQRREKEVEKNYPAFVEKMKSGADKWGWYAGQLQAKKDKAVGMLRQEKADLSKALSELVGNQSATDKLTVQSVASENQAKMEQYSSKKERNMRFLGYFGVGCLGVVAFISIMLSLIGYSDIEQMDMKDTKQPFRQAPTKAAAVTSTPPGSPDAVPVRATNQYDAWELERRQQQAEARIQEMEARLRQEQQDRERAEEQRRQIEEQHRQELARKAEEERQKAELRQKQGDKKAPEALSDKGSGKLSAKITDKGVEFDGNVYGLSELSKLKDSAQKWYARQFTSAKPATRARNKAKWEAVREVFEQMGCTIEYRDKTVSIEGGQLVVK